MMEDDVQGNKMLGLQGNVDMKVGEHCTGRKINQYKFKEDKSQKDLIT